jgi:hypothetical protein
MDGLDQDDPATVKSRRCGAAAPYRKLKTREGRPCPSFEEAASHARGPLGTKVTAYFRSPIPPHSGFRQSARGGLG